MGLLSSGKGSMILDLDAHDVQPGEYLTGRVTFTVDQAVKSGGVYVIVRASERQTQLNITDRDLHDTRRVTIFKARKDLQGRKTYPPGKHGPFAFRIRIPDLNKKPAGIGAFLRKASRGFAAITGGNQQRWEIYAEVDLKGGWDLRDTKRIHVSGS